MQRRLILNLTKGVLELRCAEDVVEFAQLPRLAQQQVQPVLFWLRMQGKPVFLLMFDVFLFTFNGAFHCLLTSEFLLDLPAKIVLVSGRPNFQLAPDQFEATFHFFNGS